MSMRPVIPSSKGALGVAAVVVGLGYAFAAGPPTAMQPAAPSQSQIDARIAAATAGLAKASDLTAEVTRATSAEQTVQGLIPSDARIASLAPVQKVNNAIGNVTVASQDMSGYATTAALSAVQAAIPDTSGLATKAALASAQALIPTAASTAPPMEMVGGAPGSTMTFRRGDAIQPRITRSTMLTLDASGNATFDWGSQGQAALTGKLAIMFGDMSARVACYTTSPTATQNTTGASFTSVSIHCDVANSLLSLSVSALSAALTAGLSAPLFANAAAGTSVGILVIPPS